MISGYKIVRRSDMQGLEVAVNEFLASDASYKLVGDLVVSGGYWMQALVKEGIPAKPKAKK